jgi:hypothetical protein
MRALIASLLVAMLAGTAYAADEAACFVAGHLVQADFALPRVAAAIAAKHLKIVVLGSASSALPGAEGPAKAYPARLEDSLARRLPGVDVKVVTHTKARDKAIEMGKTLELVVADDKPDLVIWQTGTVDAMLGVDPDDFRSALDEGVDTLQAGKADTVFMNMQYSPRTDAVISTAPYAEAIRWVALEHAVNLFDRQAIMRQWSELGSFDLLAATKSLDTAGQVHNCIGHLLAGLVVEAISTDANAPKEIPKQ